MNKIEKGVPVLHVYGQATQHDSLLVIGNRDGLLALRAAIDAALDAPLDCDLKAMAKGPEPGPMARDGEHYDVVVWRDDSDWQGEAWQDRSFPYVDIDYLDCSTPRLPAYPIPDCRIRSGEGKR